MDICYRQANQEDVSGIFKLFQELKQEGAQVGFAEVQKVNEIEAWISDPDVLLVIAEDDEKGKITGVFRGIRGSDHRKHSSFITAAIHRDYRGQHIAKKLTLFSLNELKTIGVKIARTYVYSDNTPSLNTLLSCGFTIAGSVVMHHYSEKTKSFVDDVILHKYL